MATTCYKTGPVRSLQSSVKSDSCKETPSSSQTCTGNPLSLFASPLSPAPGRLKRGSLAFLILLPLTRYQPFRCQSRAFRYLQSQRGPFHLNQRFLFHLSRRSRSLQSQRTRRRQSPPTRFRLSLPFLGLPFPFPFHLNPRTLLPQSRQRPLPALIERRVNR